MVEAEVLDFEERRRRLVPKCVRVGALDSSSRSSLIIDHWREIGTLTVFSGYVAGCSWDAVIEADCADRHHAMALIHDIEWSGRLWADDQIDRSIAIDETTRFIEHVENVFVVPERALLVPGGERIELVGVRSGYEGLGVAKRLIKHWLSVRDDSNKVIAGTYTTNVAACRLYSSLGMQRKEHLDLRVFHK